MVLEGGCGVEGGGPEADEDGNSEWVMRVVV